MREAVFDAMIQSSVQTACSLNHLHYKIWHLMCCYIYTQTLIHKSKKITSLARESCGCLDYILVQPLES